MKDAIVLVQHLGDDGQVSEGQILTDMSNKRFEALEKNGLVREATRDEIEKGYTPELTVPGVDQASETSFGGDQSELLDLRDKVDRQNETIEQMNRDAKQARDDIITLTDQNAALSKARDGEAVRADDLDKALTDATKRAEAAEGKIAELESKAAEAPDNKKAADPANKAAK
ncbi:hypothetical protein [Sphingobium sp.]|uniref:hypothetical protein n=1 Tax=Sphingobium sp. TaxID=1912891 RepID=UPI003BB6FAB9